MKDNKLKDKIISAMAAHNLTLADIAEAMAVNPASVSDWTRGAIPRPANLKKLNDYLASLPSPVIKKKEPLAQPPPVLKRGDWVRIGQGRIDAYVMDVPKSERHLLRVAFLQNGMEAISDIVEWRDDRWVFVFDGPSGHHLYGSWKKLLSKGPRQ